jgi:2-hydroxychromene-2-carboxylate isomerase
MNTERRPIDFYFDFSSPYSYIASEWIEALAARHGRTVAWKPILLGVVFRAAELRPLVSYPIKGGYSLLDIERSARFAGVPLTMPTRFPISTHNAARLFWWLHDEQPERAGAWARHCLRAYFTRGVDLSDALSLRDLASDFGVDASQAADVCSDAHWKERLVQVNEAAIAAGVFGAPHFVVDGEPFWGNDRRVQIERWLEHGPF